MISHSVPLVRFGNTLVNLAHVDYAMTKEERASDNRGYPKTYHRFIIYFRGDRKLTWTYDTAAEATDALERFHQLNEMFMMAELP